MELEIISPEKKIYFGEAESVTLPGVEGLFSILDHHAPLISVLKAGKISYKKADHTIVDLDVDGGFVEVNNNRVIICVENETER